MGNKIDEKEYLNWLKSIKMRSSSITADLWRRELIAWAL